MTVIEGNRTDSSGRLCQQTENVNNCRIWKEEKSGQGMTEQSKNRRRQDKVIKDRTLEGEAGQEGRRGEGMRGKNRDRIGQDGVGNRTESSLW